MVVSTEPGPESRLEDLAADVHAARQHEVRRRVERHRITAALVALVLVTVGVAAFAVASTGEDGAGAPSSTTRPPATSSTRPTASTTGTTDPRPSSPPPVGTIAHPASLLVLVDRERSLPTDWAPSGMVTPQLRWATTDATERRLLRPEAAAALDRLGAAAERDGLPIIGISAFRSQGSQQQVYDRYVRTEGEAAARSFSAQPGHSEHQTGLAVDVTSADGACPTEPCFGATPHAAWLAAHAPEYGFIVRYPVGKELITTYEAEPWHLRYVGVGPAQAMQRDGLTLDEYLRAA